MKWRNGLFFWGIVCALALLPACIERDNPWDLYNGCHPVYELPYKQDSIRQEIDAVVSIVNYADGDLELLYRLFQNRIDTNTEFEQTNRSTILNIGRLEEINVTIDSVNRQAPIDSTVLKNVMGANVLIAMQLAPTRLPGRQMTPDSARDRIDDIIVSAGLICPKQDLLEDSYADSIRNFIAGLADKWDLELENIVRYNNRMLDSNRIIDSINLSLQYKDFLVKKYNDSLTFLKMPQVADPVEIQRRIDSVAAGAAFAIITDSVYLQKVRFVGKGAAGTWAKIVGIPYRKTVISVASWPVEINASHNIRLENFIFAGAAGQPGIRIIEGSDSICFVNCVFSDCETRAVEADNCGYLRFENCVFLRNGALQGDLKSQGGLRLTKGRDVVDFVNVLVAANNGYGIDIDGCRVNITGGTFAGNALDGIRFSGQSGKGALMTESALFAFNGGCGIYRNNEIVVRDVFATASDNNRFFGNVSGEMGGSPAMAAENEPFFGADPVFVNSAVGDYHIGSSSLLYGAAVGYQYP